MTISLNKKETFNGITYYGRTVKLPHKDEVGFEELSMFEDTLADVLLENDEYVSEEARDIDERIFCYVPREVLQHDDDYVIQWCKENDIDL